MSCYNISFLGAGKVAEALCLEFFEKGHVIGSIVSPGKVNGARLAERCGAEWSATAEFGEGTDIIIAAVPDHLLLKVIGSVKCGRNTIVAHTAGSFGLEVFPDHIKKRAVFYPLQTFSKERRIKFGEIPVFTESSDSKTESVLRDLADSIGTRSYPAGADQRRLLHIAAVFASNFTNHMLTSGKNISARAGYPFEILFPLIRETISKAMEYGPENSQTGPAVRNDVNIIERHLELLSFSPGLRNVYEEVTRSILIYYKEHKRDE